MTSREIGFLASAWPMADSVKTRSGRQNPKHIRLVKMTLNLFPWSQYPVLIVQEMQAKPGVLPSLFGRNATTAPSRDRKLAKARGRKAEKDRSRA
jgi:hypothetical protein